MSTTRKPIILFDDGTYYIEHNVNYPITQGNGFLLRRCAITVTTPGGYECVGIYERTVTGKWKVSIDAPDTAESDSVELGRFADRLDAISVLWKHRHEAFCRHPQALMATSPRAAQN